MDKTGRVKPFKALYYNQDRFKDLSRLVCPPYDIISSEQAKKLKKSSAYNYSNLILKGNSSYKNIGRKFNSWIKEEVLCEDSKESLYLVLQEFRVNGAKFMRKGFLGLLKLDDEKVTFPHEKTYSKPKKDRLSLLKEVKANLSPVFIIYPQKDKTDFLSDALKKYSVKKPLLKVSDSENVKYKVWRVSSDKDIKKFTSSFNRLPLLIADGHHRFEAAGRFFRKNKAKSDKFDSLNYLLAYFCPADENLKILATHRVLKKKLNVNALVDKLIPYFSLKVFNSPYKAEKFLSRQKVFSFGFYQDRKFAPLEIKRLPKGKLSLTGFMIFSLKDRRILDKMYPRSPDKKLDVSLLHNWVFKRLLRLNLKEGDILYPIGLKPFLETVKKSKGCGFLVRRTKISDIMDISFQKKTLPQKTTYFYPKLLSGLILRRM